MVIHGAPAFPCLSSAATAGTFPYADSYPGPDPYDAREQTALSVEYQRKMSTRGAL